MSKHRHKNKASQNGRQQPTSIHTFHSGRKVRVGELGVFERDYPPKTERTRVVEAIKAIPELRRSPDQWWMLGEYLVYGGLLEESEEITNDGIGALMRGANLAEPSVACLLDLAWILAFKGMEAMALPYIERAASLAPTSRDVAALKAHIQMGMGDESGAIATLENAVSMPNATDSDRNALVALRSGAEPRSLRKRMMLRKIGLDDPEIATYPTREQALVAVHVAKQIYDLDPTDLAAAEALGYARYCANQLDRAKPLILSVVSADPKKAHMWTLLGLIEKKTDNLDGEVEMYRKALEADPDHVLALVNLASRIQDEDPYAARPLLERALRLAEPDNPHLNVALDLMGNSVGLIERDYLREVELHRRAIRLGPNVPSSRVNLILSLLSAGRPRDAKREWQVAKDLVSLAQSPFPIQKVIEAFLNETMHPYECLQLADALNQAIGNPGLALLVERAWKRRVHVPADERLEFLNELGQLATKFDCNNLAVSIWREAAELDRTATVNEAVALDRVGRNAEALELIEHAQPSGDRYHTCLGNIRWNAGLLKAAVEAYRTAVETEAIFELPYTNAFACIERLREPELARPFIDRLQATWPDGPKKSLLLGEAHLVGGRPSSACRHFKEALLPDDVILSPEEIFGILHDTGDHSLLVQPSPDYHLAYAAALMRARKFAELRDLIAAVFEMPRWANGDWKVLNAEIARLNGSGERLSALLEGMEDQIPAQISKALVAIENGDVELASSLVTPVLTHPSAAGFRHPEGHPDSLAHAISSIALRSGGQLEEAVAEGREAITRDVGCVIARAALVNALLELRAETDAIGILEDGLRRLPSEPRMVRLAVETMVSMGRVSEAETVLGDHRSGLSEFGAADLGFRLGELVLAAKFAAQSASEGEVRAAEAEWPWVTSLDNPIRRWLIGAHRSKANLEELRIAFMMYVGKVAEKLIADRILIPFRNGLANPAMLADAKYRDFSGFIQGDRPPSIGGFVLFLKAANKPRRPSDSLLVSEFRDFLRGLTWRDAWRLRDRRFVDALDHLAGIRNSSAHTDEPGLEEILLATSLVIREGKPGPLFAAVGL